MNLAIGLPLRDPAGLTAFLEELYDPASPSYRQYLTPEQFTEKFGPTEADYQKVIEFARNHGLTVTQTHGDRMLLDVSGPVGAVESAFGISMQVYQHPMEARTFFSPDVEPTIEAGIPIQDISGLSDFELPRPRMSKPIPVRPGNHSRANAGSGPGGLFMGSDFRAIYAPGVTQTGSGQSIGLLEFDGYYTSDVSQYLSMAGLPTVPVQTVLLDGFNGVPTTGANSGNSEVALDIEMVNAMAPGLSNIVVYEAGPNGLANDILSAMSSNTVVKQFACSWSFGTTPRTTMDSYFQKMVSQGQCFCAASGDSGAYLLSIPQPSDDPYIVLVGGTTVGTSGPGGAWISETTWNAGDGFFLSSGGVSTSYNIPTWQQGINMTTNRGSTIRRNVPDVSMVAENILIVADNGQQEGSGGTSASAQLYAAFVALANQQAAAKSQPPVGFINPATYAIAKSAAFAANFEDVITGNNTNTSSLSFFAVPGYDLCTGWGAPSGGSMLISLVTPDGFQVIPGRPCPVAGPLGGPFDIPSQSLTLTNSGTNSLSWSLVNTSLWLNATPASGTLAAGGPATIINLSLTAAASTLATGAYTANIWLTNSTSHLAQLRQVTIRVGREMIQDGGFEVGDFAYWNISGPFSTDNNFVDDGTVTGLLPFAGTYFAVLGATNSLDFLTQIVPTRQGQPYLLRFLWESVNFQGNGTTPNQFRVRWNGTTLMNSLNVGVTGWTSAKFLVQGAATNSTLEFAFRDDPSYLGLDAVSLTPIPLPTFQSVSGGSGKIQFSWATMSGLNYQLQYKTDLTTTNWVNLGSKTNATGAITSASDVTTGATQRFYRVAMVP